MGNPKQKWTAEEEQALRDGVAKYGAGKWKCIHNDPAFSIVLHSRSNIDLKDKWRNLSAAAQGLTTRSRTPKPKLPQDTPLPAAAAAVAVAVAAAAPIPAPPVNVQPPPVVPIVPKPATNHVKEEPVKDIPDVKTGASDTAALIFEALSTTKEPNGLDIGSIYSYVEQRNPGELTQNSRKLLGGRLRRLVLQEKLEKIENCYRLKKNPLVETNASNRKDVRPRQIMIPAQLKINESLEEAAKTAAYKVAEAEEKTYFAALSVREAERLSKLQEESDAMLQLAQEIYDTWHNNEVVVA
ncbi:single myb histone 3-like isoform X2 [Silene latifolia]|uniref:single myb histone 3-like isoform X2 n=1 Tax=Silene latifolia TaxID=37657 RepID=UPI003D770717